MANIIKAIRALKKYSQNDVAKAIKMSPRTYFTKENNPKLFTIGEIEELANFLQVNKEIFFKEKVSLQDTID